jgi:phosphoribosylformylglycinamidine synthase
MVGILNDVTKRVGMAFTHEGDQIALIGDNRGELGGSQYLKTIHKQIAGAIPSIDLAKVNQTIAFLVEAADKGLLKSAHDIADGGLAVALAECCFQHLIGADINYHSTIRPDAYLFGESRPLVIISFEKSKQAAIEQICKAKKLTFSPIGITGGEYLNINDNINCLVHNLRHLHEDTIPRMMDTVGR